MVHCALSQVRGPKCARRCQHQLIESDRWSQQQTPSPDIESGCRLQGHLDRVKETVPQVQVLQTGFEGFKQVRVLLQRRSGSGSPSMTNIVRCAAIS